MSTVTTMKNRALTSSSFQPKPNLVKTTRACVPVVTPYFDKVVRGSFFNFIQFVFEPESILS